MESKSEDFIYNFLKQYAPKNDKSIFGKLINRMKKRDAKAKAKGLNQYIEENNSDFDF